MNKLMWITALLALSLDAAAHGDKAPSTKKEQTAWGIAGEAKQARRTIGVGMADTMRFTPERIDVRLGETIRFVVRNQGRQMHEFVIGTKAENARHAELMMKHPTMEHDEPYMAHVAPGKTGEIVWIFNRAGEFEFACLVAGHYGAGMKGTIHVAASRAQSEALVFVQAAAPEWADGEVRKIDAAAAKVTLKHGDIRSLDMPPMTMVFAVKDKALLEKIKVGDKVRFQAINDAGRYTITEIRTMEP